MRSRSTRRLATTALMAAWVAAPGVASAQRSITYQGHTFFPVNCTRNSNGPGNITVCSITLLNEGPSGTISASVARELVFVDNGNVAHRPSSAYFGDGVNNRQSSRVMGKGASTALTVELADLGSAVTSGTFVVGSQRVGLYVIGPMGPGGQVVSQPASGAPVGAATGQGPLSSPQSTPSGTGSQANTPAFPSIPGQGAIPQIDRVTGAVNRVGNAADTAVQATNSASQAAGALKSLKSSFKSLFGSSPAPASPPASGGSQPAAPAQTQEKQ